jgi:hypothetical protein
MPVHTPTTISALLSIMLRILGFRGVTYTIWIDSDEFNQGVKRGLVLLLFFFLSLFSFFLFKMKGSLGGIH